MLVMEAATSVTSLRLDSNDLASLPPAALARFTLLSELLSVCDNRLQVRRALLSDSCSLPPSESVPPPHLPSTPSSLPSPL